MRTSIFYTLLAWFAFTCMQVNAQELTKIYSGEKIPTEEGWMELKMDETISPVAGTVSQELTDGVLKLRATDADKFTQLGWYKTGLRLDPATGYTIVIKAKVTNASRYGAFNIQGFDKSGKGFRIGIYKDYLTEWTNPLAATNVLKSGLSNDDAFHVYRITVDPNETVTIYRDMEEIGTFPLADFYFDNIIENGGFEDGDDDFDNAAFFPDFMSNSLLYRTDDPNAGIEDTEDETFIHYVKTGKYALVMNSDGKYEANGEEYDPDNSERARTWDIPVKPDTKYDISISRCRIAVEPYAWRDFGVYYDFQAGSQNDVDERDFSPLFEGANEDYWQTHNQTILTAKPNSLRFEFPSWKREDNTTAINAFDDIYLSENIGLSNNPIRGLADPVFPDNFVNLITNGGFEDWTINHDGSAYDWALSNPDDRNNNEPVAFNPLWNGNVRIQRANKPDDEVGRQWAHSGQSSLRFSSLGRHESFAFEKELEPNKTYRFNFWHRSPKWPETAWVKVKIGDNHIWGHELGCPDWNERNNVWTNADMTFTTTNDNKTLSLYVDTGTYGDWFNIFFDDFVLYELPSAEDPLLAGKTNLIINGDFEDDMIDNEGNPYMWALASDVAGEDDNYPVAWNDMWGSYVRLQDKQKIHDTGLNWAHSGNNSLRFSYLNDKGRAEESNTPDAYQVNMDFRKELEPNKTYTFVFWIKTANYPDRGDLMIANGDELLWKEALSTKFISWSRQSVTFSTTEENHTLKMFTEWTHWYNFYLDDLFLYEEETYDPLAGTESYLFFGKSMGTQSADVEIAYVAIDTTGAYEPTTGVQTASAAPANIKVRSLNGELQLSVQSPAAVKIYTVTGIRVAQLNVEKAASIALPQGIYIVKSVAGGMTETVKVINN